MMTHQSRVVGIEGQQVLVGGCLEPDTRLPPSSGGTLHPSSEFPCNLFRRGLQSPGGRRRGDLTSPRVDIGGLSLLGQPKQTPEIGLGGRNNNLSVSKPKASVLWKVLSLGMH